MNKVFLLTFLLSSFVFSQEYGSFTDSRDGKTYKTVKIGKQIWMAENLNYDNGEGSFCYYDDTTNCRKYGRLYTWEKAKSAVPDGWHLPSEDEIKVLLNGGNERSFYFKIIQGGFSGFNALLGGYDNILKHKDIDYSTFFWLSTEYDNSEAKSLFVSIDYKRARIEDSDKRNGYSLRCIKNNTDIADNKIDFNSSAYDSLFTDLRDGKIYKTKKIGKQIWMTENLNYDAGKGSYCYMNDSDNCNKYGRLYNWETAFKAVPKGWHLPSESEAYELLDYLGNGDNAFTKMIIGGSSRFNLLLSGMRETNGNFEGITHYESYWTSTLLDHPCALTASYYFGSKNVIVDKYYRDSGRSVRCIKN